MSILLMEVMELEAQPEIDFAQFGERWMYRDWDLSELHDAVRDRALPVRGMMTPEEQRVLERLPEVLTVYRGTWEGAAPGGVLVAATADSGDLLVRPARRRH